MKHFDFQQALFHPILRMMNRGIRIDTGLRSQFKKQLLEAQMEREATLQQIVGHPLNVASPKQLSDFFFKDLNFPGVRNVAGDGFTTNSNAMAIIADREPLLKPLCLLIVELRSIRVFLQTFINASLDTDGRMRCSFSIAGPTTFRFSSSENAFGSGMNLQNIPVEEKQKIKSPSYIKLPNIRKLFIPDEGYTFFDMDLDRADLQVVVWEADDANMKKALRLGLDMHCVNACDLFEIKGIPLEELQEGHPNYHDHRKRIGEAARGKAKAGVHATNYGVGDRKLSQTLGITLHEASHFRARWFAARPGIKKWHIRTEEAIAKHGFIENRFGARLHVLGRPNLPELLAWLPQKYRRGGYQPRAFKHRPSRTRGADLNQILLQVHDSLGGQFLTSKAEEEIPRIRALSEIPIPYEDPLIIPVGINTSTQSWGHCKG